MPARNPRNSGKLSPDSKVRFPPWLITYSDLITLLLTFFILLMSMADLDPVRFDAASNSLKGAFGIRPLQSRSTTSSPIQHDPPILHAESIESRIISALHKKLVLGIEDLASGELVEIARSDTGELIVRIQEALLFESGKSQLSEPAVIFLDRLAQGIKTHPIDMRIEGHCDRYESSMTSEDAWELSTARAVSVMRHYITSNMLAADRLSAAGYGDSRPVANADEPAARSVNRRVDIILQAHVLSGTGSAVQEGRKIPL